MKKKLTSQLNSCIVLRIDKLKGDECIWEYRT
jgi:hypothetical protein